ncbi:glycosyltransferase family 4 protein [Leptospira interrogans]
MNLGSRIRVLLIIEQCNPDWPSVPLVGYKFYLHLKKYTDVTLVTHERNEQAIKRRHPNDKIIIIRQSRLASVWHRIATRISTFRQRTVWSMYHTLTYPIYAEFDRRVLRRLGPCVVAKDYDVVHVITPMLPRYPYGIHRSCGSTPFVIGPVNGGVPYPKGFESVARSEYAFLNNLRRVGRWAIPEYRKTYENADQVFCGSIYTKNLITNLFRLKRPVLVMAENGLEVDEIQSFERPIRQSEENKLRVLFVGRLVPYKGADLVISAVALLPDAVKKNVSLTIVGDGSEKFSLGCMVEKYKLDGCVRFAGWVEQSETQKYYRMSDVFCFPSVREFGGAVVLEAMANNLPCIVVDNGGIAEYVTENVGFKIEPRSREYVVSELAALLCKLAEQPKLRREMAQEAGRRALDYTWKIKAQKIVAIYKTLMTERE